MVQGHRLGKGAMIITTKKGFVASTKGRAEINLNLSN
jgi:hypothetical protein